MTNRIPLRPRRMWTRAVLALSCAGVLTFTGLPGIDGLSGTAYAAKGKRCDDTFKLTGRPGSNFPWDQNIHVRDPRYWDSYNFDAPRQSMDGLTLKGTPQEQRAFLEDLDDDYKTYPKNSPDRVYAQYRDYLARNDWKDTRYGGFEKWLKDAWILPNNNNRKGWFFERKVVKDMGLLGPDWLCQEEVQVRDKNGKPVLDKDGKPVVRKFDAVNYKTNQFMEFKAGPTRDTKQDFANKTFLEDPKRSNARITYVNGESKDRATSRYLGELAKSAGMDNTGRPRVTAYEHRSNSNPDYTRGKYSKPDPNLSPGGNNRASGGASRVIDGSAATPRDMKERMDRIRANDPMGNRGRGAGGVDFSTLELSYVGTPVKGKGLPYAFSARKVDEEEGLGYGGKAKSQLISDSFLTWLALTPDKFWVNLNPDEPDRIMDKKFGTTDAGRVLLEADLEMKHDYAKLMDPRKQPGKRYWDAMTARGIPCGTVVRNWIVPEPAKVREEDGGLYILDAPLKVKSVASSVDTPSPNGDCELTDAQRKTSQRLVNRHIIPEVEKKVNSGAAYADLRRAYTARVAAEWIRTQDRKTATDYRPVINSNNVTKWPLRGANKDWKPKQTFDAYVKSFTEGDYSYPCEVDGQNKTCVMGGVDFSKAPKRNTTKIEFTARHRHLPRTAKFAADSMADDAERENLLLLGGGAETRTGGGGDDDGPMPTPTPTDNPSTPGPDATDNPSTPGPDPTNTSNPGGTKPDDNRPDPDGDLADTGSDTPVGLITGLAAVLLAAGGTAVWWMRRRRALQD